MFSHYRNTRSTNPYKKSEKIYDSKLKTLKETISNKESQPLPVIPHVELNIDTLSTFTSAPVLVMVIPPPVVERSSAVGDHQVPDLPGAPMNQENSETTLNAGTNALGHHRRSRLLLMAFVPAFKVVSEFSWFIGAGLGAIVYLVVADRRGPFNDVSGERIAVASTQAEMNVYSVSMFSST